MDIRLFSGSSPILIDPHRIDENPGPYCMSFGFDIKPLASSIESLGLINAPLVRRRKDDRYDIVAGYRRIKALIRLGQDRIPCIDLSNSRLSDLELLSLNLHDNLSTRDFNPVEKGMVLNRLKRYMSKSEVRKSYAPLLKISGSRDLETLFRIEELETPGMELLARGIISLKSAGLLLDMDDRSREIVINWFSNIRFNFNQQLKFIEYINDISIKEERVILELLDEDPFSRLLLDRSLNDPQKARRLLDLLRNRRLPRLSASEKSFRQEIKRLNLPKNVKIVHPVFFEAPGYLLEAVFRDGKELKETIEGIARTDGLEEIKDPWKKD